MLRKLVAAVCALTLFSSFAFAKPAAYSFAEVTPQNAAIRSLILPGWGQVFNQQQKKGYIIGGAAFVTFMLAYTSNATALKTYDDYTAAGIKAGTLYSDYEGQQSQAMMMSLVCLGVWAYGVYDAYKNGGQSVQQEEEEEEEEVEEESRRNTGFSLAFNNEHTRLSYTARF